MTIELFIVSIKEFIKNATVSDVVTITKCKGSQKEVAMIEMSESSGRILNINDAENLEQISEAQLVRKYSDSVYRFCLSLVYRREDADDLFQDTYLHAFTKIKKINSSNNPQGLLFAMAASIWKSRKRRYARRNRLAPEIEWEDSCGAVDQHTMLDGVWEFDLDLGSRFTSVTELQYLVSNTDELEKKGIFIESITVLPSVCTVEASIDFNKAGLADPDNINRTDSPRLLGKLDWLNSHVHAVSGDSVYTFISSDYTEVTGRVVKCRFEIDSMFFDAPEKLTLMLEGYNGTTIEIPLTLSE